MSEITAQDGAAHDGAGHDGADHHGVVLVINSGSSSLKYQVVDGADGTALAVGLIERIGQDTGTLRHTAGETKHTNSASVPDHTAAIGAMLAAFAQYGPDLDGLDLAAVGHRVVQGGSEFSGPVLIDDAVIDVVQSLVDLAPLHNPANLDGIRAAQEVFADLPHVAVFDTAFHQTLPAHASTYAIDKDIAAKHRIRRYGFHGTSHQYVSRLAAEHLGLGPDQANLIVLHLGNGASVTAIERGRSVDTSMGLTPLEGLVMGTRSGDIDPAIILHLARTGGMSVEEIDTLLNRQSGMLGLTGHVDMRDVGAAIEDGDHAATLALEIYCYRLRKYVGAYLAVLGHVDAVVFTAGVGENAPEVRAGALAGLERLGIAVDPERNAPRTPGIRLISPDHSDTAVLVVPTNEELEITRQALALVRADNRS